MTTPTLAPEIAAFAAAVRAEMHDLTADEVDDLTDGLEADLVERHADAPEEAFGDPTAYAAELRAAAGHPPRPAGSRFGGDGIVPRFRSFAAVARSRWEALLERRPVIAGTVSMLASLRPVWWVFRGAVIGGLLLASFVGTPIPNAWGAWLALIAAVLISVQVGRRRWLQERAWQRGLVVGIDVALVLFIPFLLGGTISWLNDLASAHSQTATPFHRDGLTYNGANVSNIFAYDAAGNPIERVQLFDQSGDPINLAGDPEMRWAIGSHDTLVGPSTNVTGRTGWNVYPLGELNGPPSDPDAFVDLREPDFPFVVVRPLAGDE